MSVVLGATAQTSHLTFDDALLLGFEHNPVIVAADYAEQAAHRERQAAIGLFTPKLRHMRQCDIELIARNTLIDWLQIERFGNI